MSDLAIKVENLSKVYRIGETQPKYKTLRDTLMNCFKNPFKKFEARETNSIKALSNISFEIKKGEVVGIIGKNGSGKSTLLKILARITEPTEGCVELTGRVGSLLEVGTGFHPELTGRENIYLSSAILGMNRNEINRKFNEIVAFSEIEKFIDTPVKHYSSGMYMRLAFAVAAHLETEILLVDEVLAVGDADFQKKCLGKMQDVSAQGRTVLFVSHNMAAVESLCKKSILLQSGKIVAYDDCEKVIRKYQNMSQGPQRSLADAEDKCGNGLVHIKEAIFLDQNRKKRDVFKSGEVIRVKVEFESFIDLNSWYFLSGVRTMNMHVVAATNTRDLKMELGPLKKGIWQGEISISALNLVPGNYWIAIGICNGNREILEVVEDALLLKILQEPIYGTCELNEGWGVVIPQWKFDFKPESTTS